MLARPRVLMSDKDGPAYSGASLREISAQGQIGQFDRFHEEQPFEPAQSPFGLSFPLALLRRQMLLILAITILGTAGVGLWVSTLQKSYTATALLVLDQRSSNLLEPVTQNKIEADGEVEILKSDSVALRVVERLNLADEIGAPQAEIRAFQSPDRNVWKFEYSADEATDAAPTANEASPSDDPADQALFACRGHGGQAPDAERHGSTPRVDRRHRARGDGENAPAGGADREHLRRGLSRRAGCGEIGGHRARKRRDFPTLG